jgi:hypothetical protein
MRSASRVTKSFAAARKEDGAVLNVIALAGAEAGDDAFLRILVHSNKDANHIG